MNIVNSQKGNFHFHTWKTYFLDFSCNFVYKSVDKFKYSGTDKYRYKSVKIWLIINKLVNFWVIIKILNFWAHLEGRDPVNLTSLKPCNYWDTSQVPFSLCVTTHNDKITVHDLIYMWKTAVEGRFRVIFYYFGPFWGQLTRFDPLLWPRNIWSHDESPWESLPRIVLSVKGSYIRVSLI